MRQAQIWIPVMRLLLSVFLAVFFADVALAEEVYVVHSAEIVDRKAVIATVEPVHQLVARARIGGTIVSLAVKEGDTVAAGARIALVADEKLALQMQALDARIASQQSQRDQAKTDYDRVAELAKRGVSTQTQLDQAKTNLDVAERNLAAIRSDRDVVAQQASEGAVLSPGAGRALTVPVSVGRVVLPGETIATLAEDQYILRLELPERHARFLRAGDAVRIGSRGLQDEGEANTRAGRVRIVYPEIQGGRVIADVEVSGLGDYFVGERTRVYVDTGMRRTIVVPASYVYQRAGVNYVRLAGGDEVVVQPGETRDDRDIKGVEILAGLKDGDRLTKP
jgi:membrane fusion protein, multidrug efflux system